MAQGQPVDDITKSEVLGLWQKHRERIGKSYSRTEVYQEIGLRVHLNIQTIANIIREHTPTVNLARAKMRASASKLVERVVEKASVSEAMDILSRPNMGVLAPAKQVSGGGGGGFFLSVSAESLSSVKVGVALLEAGRTPEGDQDAESNEDEYADVDEPGGIEAGGGGAGGEESALEECAPYIRPRTEILIEAAREKLRRHLSGHQGEQGIQGPHGRVKEAEIV